MVTNMYLTSYILFTFLLKYTLRFKKYNVVTEADMVNKLCLTKHVPRDIILHFLNFFSIN